MESAHIVGVQIGRVVERVRSAHMLSASASRIQAIVDNVEDGIVTATTDGHIESVNPALAAMFGYDGHELVGLNLQQLMPEPYRSAHQWALGRYLETGEPRVIGNGPHELKGLRKDGSVFPIHLTVSEIREETLWLFTGIIRDMTDWQDTLMALRENRKTLDKLAYYDTLTGLPNRAHLLSELEKIFESSDSRPVALHYIDLNGFKITNDVLGHKGGDELLQQVARRLRHTARSTDFVARLSGDEFIIVMPLESRDGQCTLDIDANQATAATAADRLIEALRQPYHLNADVNPHIGASIGISLFPHDSTEAHRLLELADAAMYAAKRTGTSTYRVYSEQYTSERQRYFSLHNNLSQALANREFRLDYQPILELASGRVIALEALIRWPDGQGGYISPTEFLPVAEDSDLILPLGRWIVSQACVDASEWRHFGHEIRVSINLSMRQFDEPDLASQILKMTDEAQLQPEHVILEITEAAFTGPRSQSESTLRFLQDRGFCIAIDDFGIGHSSLSRLKELPVDLLKLDKSFISTALGSPSDTAIIESVVRMATAMSMEMVAEGVETQAQEALLRQLGCRYGQGFLYAPAMSASELPGWIAGRARD
jgi:diguanylate cyclase (GGDEF)-like protein/PAS domain S-box-containing protein